MTISISKEALDGAVTWVTEVSGITSYRTDLARGITAREVPFSGVLATRTLATPLSAVTTEWTSLSTG